MQDVLFYSFSTLTLVSGLLVIANPFSRNPVTSAMFLVLTIVWLAGLFVLLHAFFLAAIQILVYAGAVMVLFLFVIMLLDVQEEQRRQISTVSLVASLVAVGAMGLVLVTTLWKLPGFEDAQPTVQGETRELGTLLFTRYLLPFEIVSLLLLVAMVGVILLSKKEIK